MSQAAARAWAAAWERAWPAKDAAAVAALYTDDAVFRSHPFREPHIGADGARAYAVWAFEDEGDVECRFGEPRVVGDRATVEYWAVLRESGKEVTIAGVAVLRFAPDGRVAEQRDYWALEEGRSEPPPTWGR